MKILGLDLSLTETGLVALEDKEIVMKHLIKTKPDQFETEIERILYIINEITSLPIPYLDLVVIEGASLGSFKTRSLFTLGKLHGLIEMFLKENEIKYIIVPPRSLKKFITGKGNAKKELMLLKVYKKYGIEFDNNNLCDAFALAKYGEENYEA